MFQEERLYRAVVDALTHWAYGHRRLVVMASTFDEIVRRQERKAALEKARAEIEAMIRAATLP